MRHEIFKNKNCFITGATGGIGKHIALEMARNKCNLFLTSTNAIKLRKLKRELESLYGRDIKIFYESGDLSKIQDVNNIIKTVREKICSIDILINCAGVFIPKSLSESDLSDFEISFSINIRAAFILCKEFSRDMVKNRWGRIINIASSSAYTGRKKTCVYCASKHALLGLSRALHDELKKYNIRTFCISPSGVRTKMGKSIKSQNLETLINPKEVAEYIVFISSFDSEMISEEVKLSRMRIE